MIIQRPTYIDRLSKHIDNGRVKVITGLRRSGKTYLVKNLFRNFLISKGVQEDNIHYISLDGISYAHLRNPMNLFEHIRNVLSDGKHKYVIIDEIQFCISIDNPHIPLEERNERNRITFYEVMSEFIDSCDLYVTGSNSHMLSSDILTNFRGRSTEIRVYPLSFSEYLSATDDDKRTAWRDYLFYGGLPGAVISPDETEKRRYLSNLFEETYLKDITERYKIRDRLALGEVMDVIASTSGCSANPTNIANTFKGQKVSRNTVGGYISYFLDSFLIDEAKRFDVRRRRYINCDRKYYFTDLGLMNARLGFREFKMSKLLENAVYNNLVTRGYDVDIGRVDVERKDPDGKRKLVHLETDFVVNLSSERFYIQVAMGIDDPGKYEQEAESLNNIRDGFGKMILVDSDTKPYRTRDGIQVMSIIDFILAEDPLHFGSIN